MEVVLKWRIFLLILSLIPGAVIALEEILDDKGSLEQEIYPVGNSRRRHHRHHHEHVKPDSPNKFIHDVEDIPNIEDALPQSYVKKHKDEFIKLKMGTDVRTPYKLKAKEAKKENKVKMQYAEMGSMKLVRRSDPNSDLVNQNLQPALAKAKLDHIGNSLFFINGKRILSAHNFPTKTVNHQLYGNLDTLGKNEFPDTREIISKNKKKLPSVPDAERNPERLFDRNHPGLNLLHDNKMWLESAKYKKPKPHLVYGNLDNIGDGDGDQQHYKYSDFRRLIEPKSVFKRIDSRIWNRKPNDNDGEEIEEVYLEKRPIKRQKSLPNINKVDGSRNEKISNITVTKSKSLNVHDAIYGGAENHRLRKRQIHTNEMKIRNKKPSLRSEEPVDPDDREFEDSTEKAKKVEKNAETDKNKPPRLVYGNRNNIVPKINDTHYQWLYNGFRKHDDYIQNTIEDSENIINAALKAVRDSNKRYRTKKRGRYPYSQKIFPGGPTDSRTKKLNMQLLQQYLDEEAFQQTFQPLHHGGINRGSNDVKYNVKLKQNNLRRQGSSGKPGEPGGGDGGQLRGSRATAGGEPGGSVANAGQPGGQNCDDEVSKSAEKEETEETNAGNPYTLHKGKYYQNWPWNYAMDGNHMNVNPYAPKFADMSPTGAELFFGRKWWYFNQDDYKPFRRR